MTKSFSRVQDLLLGPLFLLLLPVVSFGQGSVTDRFGNTIPFDSIRVREAMIMNRGVSGYSCDAGIFQVDFGDVLYSTGVGFDAPGLLGIERRAAVCQAFSDLSAMLVPADNPYTLLPNTAPFVLIYVNSGVINGNPSVVAAATPYYNPMADASNDLNPLNNPTVKAQRYGILDSEVWRTINGGIDSYYAYTLALGIAGAQHYVGKLTVNLSNFTFYTGQAIPTSTDRDLYSTALHEITHLLDFYSLSTAQGISWMDTYLDPTIESTFYTRYDSHLSENGVPLIIDPLSCNWSPNVNEYLLNLENPCGVFFSGMNTSSQEVYAPNPYEVGSSLSHLDENCGTDQYMMAYDNGYGERLIPSQVEVNMLCDIGYHTTTIFGDPLSGWSGASSVVADCGQRLAGVDDIFADYSTKTYLSVKQGFAPIVVDNFLENDEDESSAGGIPTSYQCLSVLQGGGTATVLGSSSFEYTPDPDFIGWAVLRYMPLNSNHTRTGNWTYVYIDVRPADACNMGECNIVNGGDFEKLIMSTVGCGSYHNWLVDPLGNMPAMFLYDGGSANWVSDQWWTGSGNWPWNKFPGQCPAVITPVSSSHSTGNNHYVGSYYWPSFYPPSGYRFELCKPLAPGQTYILDYWAYNTGSCDFAWEMKAVEQMPCNPAQAVMDLSGGPNSCNGGTFSSVQIVPTTGVAPTATWEHITQTFSYDPSANPGTWLLAYIKYAGGGATPSTSMYLDDVKIHPIITADASITPSCNGQSNGSITLNVHYYNGEYDIQWSTGGTTANLSNLAPGDYTVTITDNTLGCASFTETYTVGDASCSGPFTLTKTVTPPSGNTYAGAPIMFTIQACNNDVADQVVNITDEMPAGFVPAFNSPNNPYWPTASVTIPAGECISTEITGYFTQIGPHTNTVTLEQAPGISLSADATITLLQGCPMLVYGSGGCLPGAAVNLCLGMHTQLTNVESVDYYIVYPDFLEPPAPGSILGNISSPFGISAATIGTPAPLAWPSGPGYGYATVPVHVAFTAPVSASPPYSFFCVGFQVGSAGVPPGVNAVWTWASTTPSVSGWNRVTVNMTGGSTDLWTQAYHILFTDCPGITGPNANFTAQTSSCGGAVTVSAELTDPDAIHIWTWGDERTTPTNGAPGWTYDYFGPITDNQGWPVNVPPAAPGTYTITHTVILDGVASTSTQAVTIHACCAAALSIPDGTLSSTLPSTISGTVDIQGQFVIDQNLSFNGVQVTMEPGAEIIVQPGRFLVVRDSELGSCNGTMWKGITVNSGSYLEMQRNTVKDAEYVVTAMDGATVLLFNNDITDNRVGLYVPNTPGVAFNSVSAHVIGNRINSTGTLAQAYPGQTTALGNVGFAAVLAYRTALDLTGYPGYSNTVDGMSNGILAFNSDLSVERFDLKNVQPDGAYSVPNDANGSGIHVYGRNGAHYLRQTGNGKQGPPSFQNCRRGIYTLGMNTISRDNNMQGVGTAYRVDKARKTTEITNNRVNTKLSGMEFNQNAGTLRFWVIGNDITFGTLTELVPAPLCNGILVADGNSGGQDSRIEGNTISMLSHPLAKTGINLLAARKWSVAGNSIVMGNNSINRYGIANYGSSGLLVRCNTILGAGANYPQGQAAIYSNMGEKLLFGCNNVDLTTNGMLFNGVAYDVDVRGNSIRRHKFGMHLSGNAIIGTQDLKGNLWYNPPALGGMGAWYEPIIQGEDNPNAIQYPFTYNPAIINGGSTEPTSWAPSDWFQLVPGTNYSCMDVQGESYCSQFHVAKLGGGITELDGLVAKDSLRNDPYTEESKWMLKDGLYKKLDDDPDLRDERPDMANFYAAMQGTATAAFKAIDDGRPALYNMDSTVVAQLQANRGEITALMDSVKLRMAILEDNDLSEVQRTALLADMLGFREGIRTLATWNTTAMQVATDSKVLTAEGLKVANSIIGTTEFTETNRKVVDGIYLSTIGKEIDTFTVAQSNDLFTIANQCPMLGGNAVYTARALYRLIDETYEFDDQLLCLPHGILVKRLVATEENILTVVPNPARDNATIVLGQPLERAGMLLVHDLAGKEVLRVDLSEGEPRTVFSTGTLASGLYQYRVESKGAVVGHGKLAISR